MNNIIILLVCFFMVSCISVETPFTKKYTDSYYNNMIIKYPDYSPKIKFRFNKIYLQIMF